MRSELNFLVNDANLFLVMLGTVLLFGIAAGMSTERYLSKMRRRAWQQRNNFQQRTTVGGTASGSPWLPKPETTGPRQHDAADQLRTILNAAFAAQPLLNKSEARVFKELDRMVLDCNPAWQVMAQVSLGEILRCKDADAYRCVNSKRVDLLLVDENCLPRHAIEYQGGAHYQGTAAARDAVKKEALRRAGIGYHEVVAGFTTPSELKRLVEKLVDRPARMPLPAQPATA